VAFYLKLTEKNPKEHLLKKLEEIFKHSGAHIKTCPIEEAEKAEKRLFDELA
jgi:hypothetical protein